MKERGESSPWETPFGAEWLFDRWPFRKFSGGQIGAIQLPNKKRALITFALNLMEIPFEVEDEAMRRARQTIYKTFLELN
jgi:hypothetical protein